MSISAEIGLLLGGDVDAELVALDRDDETDDIVAEGGLERNDVHGHCGCQTIGFACVALREAAHRPLRGSRRQRCALMRRGATRSVAAVEDPPP